VLIQCTVADNLAAVRLGASVQYYRSWDCCCIAVVWFHRCTVAVMLSVYVTGKVGQFCFSWNCGRFLHVSPETFTRVFECHGKVPELLSPNRVCCRRCCPCLECLEQTAAPLHVFTGFCGLLKAFLGNKTMTAESNNGKCDNVASYECLWIRSTHDQACV